MRFSPELKSGYGQPERIGHATTVVQVFCRLATLRKIDMVERSEEMPAKKSSRSKAKSKSLRKKVVLKPVKPLDKPILGSIKGDVTSSGHESWIELNS